jgi:hypothetical protein
MVVLGCAWFGVVSEAYRLLVYGWHGVGLAFGRLLFPP